MQSPVGQAREGTTVGCCVGQTLASVTLTNADPPKMAIAKECEHQGVAGKDDVHDEQDPSLSMMPTCRKANFHVGLGSPQIRPQRCPQPNNSIKAVYATVMSIKSRKYVSTCSQLRFLQLPQSAGSGRCGCRLSGSAALDVAPAHMVQSAPGEAGLCWHGTCS